MAIASIAVACTSEPATEVVLVVDADAWALENIEEVELVVGSGEAERVCAVWPRVLAFAPLGVGSTIAIEMTGFDADGNAVARAMIRGDYRRGHLNKAEFTFTEACATQPCVEDWTSRELEELQPRTRTDELMPPDMRPPDAKIIFPPDRALAMTGFVPELAFAANREGIETVTLDNKTATAETCRRYRSSIDVPQGTQDTQGTQGTQTIRASARGRDGSEATVTRTIQTIDRDLQGEPFSAIPDPAGGILAATSRTIAHVELASALWRDVAECPALDCAGSPNNTFAPRVISRHPNAGMVFAGDEFNLWEVDVASGAVERVDLPMFGRMSAMIWDEKRGRLLMGQLPDGQAPELVSFDPLTRAYRRESFVRSGQIGDFAFDTQHDRLFVQIGAYAPNPFLIEMDPITFAETPLPCPSAQSFQPFRMAFDDATQKLLVFDQAAQTLLEYDTNARDCSLRRQLHPDERVIEARSLFLIDRTAWIADIRSNRFLGIDLVSDAVQKVATMGAGEGPLHPQPWDLAYSETRREVVVLASSTSELVGVSADDGTRRVLAQSPGYVDGITIDDSGKIALVSAHGPESIQRADLDTGDVTMLLGPMSDPPITHPRAITFGEEGAAYFLNIDYRVDPAVSAIMRVELASGAQRAVVRFPGVAGGLAYDRANHRLILIEPNGELSTLDINTGAIEPIAEISSQTVYGAGSPGSVKVSRDGRRAFVLAGSAVVEVQMDTKMLTAVSSNLSSGFKQKRPWRIDIDDRRGVAYVIDQDLNGVWAADLGSGTRVLLSR